MKDLPRVALILVNHGICADRYLEECWQSLQAQDYPQDRAVVFIVDNGSSPQSKARIRALAPAARLLINPCNSGWAGGNNTALRAVLAEGFDDFALLNMDTRVESDWLRKLVEGAQSRSDLHILQSKLLIYGSDRINSMGNRIQFLGYGYCNGCGEAESGTGSYPMDYASGACMLIKREVLERIGLFRENFFMYHEDLKFCWRARRAGYQVGLVEDSVCRHEYNFRMVLQAIHYVERNRLLTLLTLTHLGTLLVLLPALVLWEVGSWIYFILRGQGRGVSQRIFFFLRPRSWGEIIRFRRQVSRLRVRRDAEIVRGFAGPLFFAGIRNPLLRILVNSLLCIDWAVARRFILW